MVGITIGIIPGIMKLVDKIVQRQLTLIPQFSKFSRHTT